MGRWGRTPAPGGRGCRWRHIGIAGLFALLPLVVAACGDDGSDETGPASSGTTGTTELPSCEDHRALVIFHVNGVLTPNHNEFGTWLEEADYVMEVRPGAVELVQAYHDLGFHVVYTSRGGTDLDVHGVPYDEAMGGWLVRHSFPLDERAVLYTEADAAGLADLLANAAGGSGAGAYAAYTSAEEDLAPLSVAGVPEERIYGLGDMNGGDGTTAVPGGDLSEHLPLVEDLDPVCVPG